MMTMNGRAMFPTARFPHGEHAVVLGGSIAGLLAAHVLAGRFERVSVVDRDELPLEARPRAGVPQARHLHHMLAHGRAALERLFPGIVEELLAAGAQRIDIVRDVAWLGRSGWAPRTPSGLDTTLCSRDLVEACIRRRLVANPRLRLLERQIATGLCAEQGRVRGVQLQPRGGGEGVELQADLVVDASGRGSRAPEWLATIGVAPPAESSVSAFLGYASRLVILPPALVPDWKVLLIQSRPPYNPRTGTMTLQEHGRWIVTLAGAARDYPPTDEAGFLAFARSLPDPTLAQLLERAEALTPIVGFRRSANRLRHFERVQLPAGFIAMGDAVCALNPYYAQGMTNAARGALVLAACLGHNWRHPAWPRRFQRRLAAANRLPWLLATGEDFRYPSTEGHRHSATRLLHWYVDRVMARATTRPALFHSFIQVMHMLKPPLSLLSPPTAARVLGL
jgi:2-polyprenyl-6-methoxyphenol hydroxylase-like FAD-dependent oxidoreductase